MTYSIDFQKKAFKIKERLSFAETSKLFGIGKTTLVRWTNRLEPRATRNESASKIDMELLKQDIKEYPNAYNYERAKRLEVSKTGIWSTLKRLNITYKKTIVNCNPLRHCATRF
ncbi:IS630 transposase-related protein [Candidatus Tisiphia endosymbiont of Xenochironomus xenolabis]|uniref:IS630 transposase-related protein n=1 Tax=unclassified Candidatus Tisiphia TaxID=2996318 RepID=UPI0035C8979C